MDLRRYAILAMLVSVFVALSSLHAVHASNDINGRGTADDNEDVILCVCLLLIAGERACHALRRTAAMGSSSRRAPKRRKVETETRDYAWEEDGWTGINKVRVKDPEHPASWKKYIIKRHLGKYRSKKFRQLFRITPTIFWRIYDRAVEDGWKEGDLHETGKSVGKGTPIPLGYKMLAYFRILAAGLPFNAVDGDAGCSKGTMWRFFHPFGEWLVSTYETDVLRWPKTEAEIEFLEKPFRGLGFPGCVASMDGVHIASDVIRVSRTGNHCGKEKYPTVVFNVCSGHNKRIINVAGPFPGAYNDKTLVQRDFFVEEIRTLATYTNYKWQCYTAAGAVQLISGLWILCDGGYLPWRTTICAFATTVAGTLMGTWNSRVGSTRKDIEDVFGILKKRFRILRLPMLYAPERKIGTVFRACCILHNMLIDHDGLADIGQAESHWIKQDINGAVSALQKDGYTGVAARHVDYNYLGRPFVPREHPTLDDQRGHHALKEALYQHFTYLHQTKQVQWLKTAAQITAQRAE